MSSSSETGSESGTPGNVSSQTPSPGSSFATPSPSSSMKQGVTLNLSSDENELKLSKFTSPNGHHTPDGVLTPPNERDDEDNPSGLECTTIPGKSNGRLKFFKDGMLCLELSHHDEGQKTKWVQVRGKLVIPQVIQVTREAVIPCQLTQPPLFSSPSNSNHVHSSSRVESSTSHSMSDDGSSILSSTSPRVRDSTSRKQPVPQRCLSINSNFYMKPASCVVSLNFRHEVHVKARLCSLRRPYSMPDFVYMFRDKVVPVESKCGLNGSGSLCMCDSLDINERKMSLRNENIKSRTQKLKEVSMHSIEKKLSAIIETRLKYKSEMESKLSNSLRSNGCNASARRTLIKSTLPKLTKREVRDRDFISVVRPTIPKKSQQKNMEKTILSVPGHVGLFNMRPNDTDLSPNLNLGLPLNFSMQSEIYVGDMADGRTMNHSDKSFLGTKNSSRDTQRPRNNLTKERKSKTSNSNIAKFSSRSTSILKSSIRAPEIVTRNSTLYHQHPIPDLNTNCEMTHSCIDRMQEEQETYNKHTVSKVISYTINSLLGTDSNGISTSKIDNSRSQRFSSNSGFTSPPLTDLSLSFSTRKPPTEIECNSPVATNSKRRMHSFSEQDCSSFLRHLLDTSDPIPTPLTTNHSSPSSKLPPTPPKKRSAINNHNNNNIAASKTIRSPKDSNPGSQSVNSESTSIVIPKPVQSFSGSRPMPQESASAVAASAYHHYTSLLPATFIPTLSAPNTYFNPSESGNPLNPMPHLNYTGDTALNLSHRGIWTPCFFPPPQFSFHDRASSEGQNLSMNRRSTHASDSNQSTEIVENDLPLNLCKKPRPN